MSLQTWKDEFYPVKPSKRMSKEAAIEHSLRKWTGLLPKNLKKHGIIPYGRLIEDAMGEYFMVEAESCALCVKYFNGACENCPLYKSLGDQCDGSFSPYEAWTSKNNPLPMIKALKKLLEEVK